MTRTASPRPQPASTFSWELSSWKLRERIASTVSKLPGVVKPGRTSVGPEVGLRPAEDLPPGTRRPAAGPGDELNIRVSLHSFSVAECAGVAQAFDPESWPPPPGLGLTAHGDDY